MGVWGLFKLPSSGHEFTITNLRFDLVCLFYPTLLNNQTILDFLQLWDTKSILVKYGTRHWCLCLDCADKCRSLSMIFAKINLNQNQNQKKIHCLR
ncbi:hypothetical protein M0802_012074 [Mischocyttarus mexicanus]|nr:hypothetical protein M0802_012074 [Mischocyttarus mexicanus]